jgi:hypothetical protein
MIRKWARTPVLLTTAAVVLSGCGGGAGPPETAGAQSAAIIVSQMKTAMLDATSVHLAGNLRSDGTAVGLDIAMDRSGAFSGSIDSAGTRLDIVDTSKRVYVKVTSAFLRLSGAPASACQRACGQFVAAPAALAQSIGGDFTMAKLLGSVRQALPSYVKSGRTTIAGQQALILHGSDGSMLYVAATGSRYPLQAIAPKAGHAGALSFSDWNAVPAITAPPASKVISISQLVG